jgi:hypothetical protein|tara:strand:- start:221 stop:556 length:336 start_codon:yes stop_codon:yes gene_type:complete
MKPTGKELTAVNPKATVVYRFIKGDRHIYIKSNDLTYAPQMITQLEAKGATVKQSRNWLKADLFATHPKAKFGDQEVDVDNDDPEKVQDALILFFTQNLEKAGFKVEVKDI